MWRDLPAPLTAKMFLFNVTNAHQVVNAGATPHVEELGPYTFYEYHHKTNIVWNENNTITYMQNRTWVFAPELSEGDLSDVVTVVNPVAAAVGYMLRTKAPKSTLWLIDGFLNAQNEQAFVTHTANEIIFRGFDDPLLKTMNSLKSFMKGVVPDGAFTDKFGFFYKRNGSTSADGVCRAALASSTRLASTRPTSRCTPATSVGRSSSSMRVVNTPRESPPTSLSARSHCSLMERTILRTPASTL